MLCLYSTSLPEPVNPPSENYTPVYGNLYVIMENQKMLSPISDYLITQFDKDKPYSYDKMISVNPVVSEVASWYEKLRNAMDFRDDDAILRAAIERIVKRRMLFGEGPKQMAEPLVRELVWARYFPEGSVPESITDKVEKIMTLYLHLQTKVNHKHRVNKGVVNEWTIHLMSSAIEHVLSPSKERELISNFMFQFFKDKIVITDDTTVTRDAQVFLAVRRTFAHQDLPLLRYHLFIQIFGELTEHNIEHVSEKFVEASKQIEYQMNYPLKDRFLSFFKNHSIPFYILEEILKQNRGKNRDLVGNAEEFKVAVMNTCAKKYNNIREKVSRAIVRGVIFILVTKAIFGLAIEGSFESLIYGEVYWNSIALNTLFPPLLMIIAALFIKTPDRDNSVRIWDKMKTIIYDSEANSWQPLILKKNTTRIDPIMNLIFIVLWLAALVLSMGTIIYVLTFLNFKFISQTIFIFFLMIVSFICYRISQTAHMYTLQTDKHSLKDVLFDFFFVPVIQAGRRLTENISKINVFLFFFDLFIETPFKVIFAFFEQWFLFLRAQREKLG